MSGYINPSQLYYSDIFPDGIYAHYANESVPLPIRDILGEFAKTPVLENILTHNVFFCKKVYIGTVEQKKTLIDEILRPATTCASWPVDLVCIGKNAEDNDGLSPVDLNHLYCDSYYEAKNNDANYILLFPYLKNDLSGLGGYANYTAVEMWLKREPLSQRTYKNDKIKTICYGIANSLEQINREGYMYFDFSLSRFMLKSDLTVVPEYSNLLVSTNLKMNQEKSLSARYGVFPLDFADPYLYFKYNQECNSEEMNRDFGLKTQNYCLAAMLFYLMFGRKPYEGQRLMQNCDDVSDDVIHYAYLRNYYFKKENIHFIFDDTYENPNLLINDYTDMFFKDIDLWENCPQKLRELFMGALQRQCALRETNICAPNPSKWVSTFESLGWGNKQ